MRSLSRCLALAALLMAALSPAPSALAAAPPATSAALVDAHLLVGQHARLSGDVGSRARPVHLQLRVGSSWRTIASTRSRADGGFQLIDRVSRVGVYRAYASGVQRPGRDLRPWASPIRRASWQTSIAAPTTFTAGTGMRSASGRYLAVMQGDGNFVVYDQGVRPQRALWSARTGGSGLSVTFQPDGNLVVYAGSAPRWSSSTAPAAGSRLTMQDDGNLVMYSRGGLAIWASYQGRLANSADAVLPRTTLGAGQALYSRSGRYRAVMQGDGNFVVYGPGGAEWSTRTGTRGASVTLQEDGNLVVYGAGSARWSSATARARDVRLVMQDDGNLVMYAKGGLPLWSSRGGRTGFGEDTLPTGAGLGTGQSLWSHDGRFNAVMQGDGNFVVYGPGGPRWSSGTGVSGSTVHMQADGNLVVYAPGGVAKWSSSTSGAHAALVMQDDGNLVVYAGGRATWSSYGNGSPGTSSATGGYPDADAVNCSATFGTYSWCKSGSWYHPSRRFAYRNCTDYVAWKKGMNWGDIQYGGSAHAYQWKNGWTLRGRSTGTAARVGAVAYWPATNANSYGHVAYVLSVNADGSAHIGEYNRGGNGTYGERDVVAPLYLY